MPPDPRFGFYNNLAANAPLAGGRYVDRVNENPTPVAWRCDHCRKLQSPSTVAKVIHIDDARPFEVEVAGAVRRRPRYIRRMVVCPKCRGTIEGVGQPARKEGTQE